MTPRYGTTNPTPDERAAAGVRRYAQVVELNPQKEALYRELHADVWPEVRAAIERANIRNYSIYVAELGGRKYLFSYFEYTGDDPQLDFASIAADPVTRDKWWPLTDACQRRLPVTPDGEQWLPLELVMLQE